MSGMGTPKPETPVEEFWRAVRYVVEWADGESVEVEQPPLDAPPPEYQSAAA